MSPVTPASRPAGRPRASSRAMLEEAAGELFLERGYAATSVADITARAGVSRNTFFNYFGAKSDLLWSTFDATVAGLGDALADPRHDDGTPRGTARAALTEVAAALQPDNVSLAFTHADTMGLSEELRRAAELLGEPHGVGMGEGEGDVVRLERRSDLCQGGARCPSRGAVVVARVREGVPQPGDRRVEGRPQQVALGAEVVEEGVAADARAGCDVRHGGGRVAALEEQLTGRFFQHRAGRGARTARWAGGGSDGAHGVIVAIGPAT